MEQEITLEEDLNYKDIFVKTALHQSSDKTEINLQNAWAILSDTNVKRSSVEWEDLKTYWKSKTKK